jgi:upstream activation factor subunit UAF30
MPVGQDNATATAPKATTKTTTTKVVKDKVVKDKVAKAPKVVAAPVAAAAPVVEISAVAGDAAPAVDANVDDTWCSSTELDSLIEEFTALRSAAASTLANLRVFKKKNDGQIKKLLKTQAKKKASNAQRKPSGFTKPTPITPELATFLGKPAGTEMARTDVTREINDYIKAHDLQDDANGRQINPDKKLATLLNVKKDDVLTYFNLQKFMSPHFIKVKAVADQAIAEQLEKVNEQANEATIAERLEQATATKAERLERYSSVERANAAMAVAVQRLDENLQTMSELEEIWELAKARLELQRLIPTPSC